MVVGPNVIHNRKFISVLDETNFVFILRFCNHPFLCLESESRTSCLLWTICNVSCFNRKCCIVFVLIKLMKWLDAPCLCSQVCWRVLWLCSLYTVSTLPVMMWLNSTHLTSTGKSYRVTVSGWSSFMPPGKVEHGYVSLVEISRSVVTDQVTVWNTGAESAQSVAFQAVYTLSNVCWKHSLVILL